MVTVDLADGQHSSEIKLSDVNMVVEAAAVRSSKTYMLALEDTGVAKEPGYSIVIAGNGAALKNMREASANVSRWMSVMHLSAKT